MCVHTSKVHRLRVGFYGILTHGPTYLNKLSRYHFYRYRLISILSTFTSRLYSRVLYTDITDEIRLIIIFRYLSTAIIVAGYLGSTRIFPGKEKKIVESAFKLCIRRVECIGFIMKCDILCQLFYQEPCFDFHI